MKRCGFTNRVRRRSTQLSLLTVTRFASATKEYSCSKTASKRVSTKKRKKVLSLCSFSEKSVNSESQNAWQPLMKSRDVKNDRYFTTARSFSRVLPVQRCRVCTSQEIFIAVFLAVESQEGTTPMNGGVGVCVCMRFHLSFFYIYLF